VIFDFKKNAFCYGNSFRELYCQKFATNQPIENMKIQKLILCTALLLGLLGESRAQQWGFYTLYATKNGMQAYLIDTNGTTQKTWTFTSTTKSAYSAYLVPGDTLVRTYKPTTAWNVGGGTGGVQKVLWNGTVVWDFVYTATNDYNLHHDICPLPNGNVLMISYDYRTAAEATQAGSSSAAVFWSEKIMEVKPNGLNGGTIVWEWYLWDHLCQNYNAAKDHYVSSIINNPQMLNINYAGTGTLPDRYHMNGLDYNAELDQIVLSIHFMNSVFVIDHSTTTAEAAEHTGGNSGKGGDFLYRWGNNPSYGASGTANFNIIHDAHWVPSDNPNYPNYLAAYNNKGASNMTAIDIWNPPYNGYNYSLTVGSAYLPANYNYRYTAGFSAQSEGNSQQLPNGNMLVNDAMGGTIYEVNSAGTTVWTKTSANTSHAYRYSMCYVRGPVVSAAASPLTVCAGDPVNLTSSALSVTETSPTYSYAWTSTPAGFTSSNQNPTANPTSTTTYTITINNTAIGCSTNKTVTVNVNPLPATPVVSQVGNDLSSTTATSYQWYLNGGLIGGATAQLYTPSQTGSYTVEITDGNGCSSTSAPFSFVLTGMEDNYEAVQCSIYPNPSTGLIHLEGSIVENNIFELEIFNTFGKRVLQLANCKIVDMSQFANGMYFIIIRSEGESAVTQKFILNK
jgi:hypothetical protein